MLQSMRQLVRTMLVRTTIYRLCQMMFLHHHLLLMMIHYLPVPPMMVLQCHH
jgi:hypothetical protein